MKKITLIALTFWLAGPAFAHDANWLTSFPEAAQQASNEGKLLLLDFTGSDWCGWCMKLDAETFSRPEFIKYAGENLVLVQIDFPMHKALSDELKKANRALKKQYKVEGFPTVVVVKPDGKVLWEQTGYVAGGPKAMIDAVNPCRRAAGLGAPPSEPAAPVAVAPVKPAAPAAAVPVQQPPPPAQITGDEPKLQGILYSASHSSAVINGRTCDEGEVVHGMRVVKITRNTVTVEFQGQTKLLRMN